MDIVISRMHQEGKTVSAIAEKTGYSEAQECKELQKVYP
jgi:hypothetical protein